MTINENTTRSKDKKSTGHANGDGRFLWAHGTYSNIMNADMNPKQTKVMMNLAETLQHQISNSFVDFGKAMNKRFEKVDTQFAKAKADSDKQFEKVNTQFAEVKAETKAQFAEAKADSDKQFAEAKADTKAQFAEVKADTKAQFAEAKADSDKQFEKANTQFEKVNEQLVKAEVERKEQFAVIKTSFRYIKIIIGILVTFIALGIGGIINLLKWFG